MGLKPMLGRTFSESDVGPNAPPVIILGYDLWQQKFNGDPAMVGKTIRLSRRETPPTVIGVMPPGVRFLPSPGEAQEPNYDVNARVDYWVPGYPDPARMKEPFWNVIARLRDGTAFKEAQAELSTIAVRQEQMDQDFLGITARLLPLIEFMNRDGRRILLPLLGAAALVLLIACGNVVALLLVRGLQRQQEYAVRCRPGSRTRHAIPVCMRRKPASGAFRRRVGCGQEDGYFEVHHVRKLSDIKDGKEKWQKLMIARRRKTMVLCVECHDLLHAGKLPSWRSSMYERSGEPCAVNTARTVRRGAHACTSEV